MIKCPLSVGYSPSGAYCTVPYVGHANVPRFRESLPSNEIHVWIPPRFSPLVLWPKTDNLQRRRPVIPLTQNHRSILFESHPPYSFTSYRQLPKESTSLHIPHFGSTVVTPGEDESLVKL